MSSASSQGRVGVGRWFGAALLLFLIWSVGYPLLITALEAFGGVRNLTLVHWSEFVSRPDEWLALWRSLYIAVLSVVLAALVGVPLAFVFERLEFPGRKALGALLALPVALPPLVGVIAFLFLWGESGLIGRGLRSFGFENARWSFGGPVAILVVHAYSMYVYFYLFVRAALARLDGALLEAARSLGASRFTVLRRVILPVLRPALLSAGLLVFMTSLSSFSAPYIFGGGFRVMTTQIVSSKLNGQLAMAQVETVALLATALLGLFLLGRFDTRDSMTGGERGTPARRRVLKRGVVRLVTFILGWGLAVFLLLPHATLVLLSLVPPHTWTTQVLPPELALVNYASLLEQTERLRPLLNSLWMASVATLLALGVGLAAAWMARRRTGLVPRLLEWFVVLPWAIPGTVFAMALAATFSVHAPLAGRFILIGTAVILPMAYFVRSLPVTGRAAMAGLRQLDGSLEEASRSLGAGTVMTWRRVLLPLLRPALLAGGGLAFVTALGDFVTSIVLYTYDTRPMSIEILSSLRLQETGVAAAFGVLLMTLSATVFLLWGRETRL